jgi:hypothetical protein
LILLGETNMYGLIGNMNAVPGQRDALISIPLDTEVAAAGDLRLLRDPNAVDPLELLWAD